MGGRGRKKLQTTDKILTPEPDTKWKWNMENQGPSAKTSHIIGEN